MIYMLGSPLTLIAVGPPLFAGRFLQYGDNWWAIPLIDTLFLLQWVIWSQLISLIVDRLFKVKYR